MTGFKLIFQLNTAAVRPPLSLPKNIACYAYNLSMTICIALISCLLWSQPLPVGRATVPAPAARLSEEEALVALRKELEKRAAEDRFSGAVLVAKNGKPVFEQAYGMGDREKKIPNRLDTKFIIGSMNKMFTAVSVAQLAQAGKLRFSDPLGKFLPDYPNAAIRRVTIHQLLTHTGGTGDIFGPEFTWANRDKLNTLQDFVKLYGKRGPEFEPGSRWTYSNYGYVLLGVIIEQVSGQSYYDYFREHIFKPAGMNSTDGGYSTVEDLLRFANALLNEKLLDAHHTELVTTGKIDTRRGGRYAYGFVDDAQEGVRWFGHEGGVPGANGDLRIYPKSGYVIAVLANLDPPAATEVTDFIGQRLPAS